MKVRCRPGLILYFKEISPDDFIFEGITLSRNKTRYATIVTPQGKKPVLHRMNECTINVPDYPLPVPISFCNCYVATGSSSHQTTKIPGLHIDDSQMDEMFQIVKVEKKHYLVYAPDLPVLDMPILIDPSGFVLRRIDFEGHYEVSSRSQFDESHEEFWEKGMSKKRKSVSISI